MGRPRFPPRCGNGSSPAPSRRGGRGSPVLGASTGCRCNDRGAVETGKCEATNVPGLYVCGDASREAQFVVVAAAEGAEAGMAIHKALLKEELEGGGEADHRK